MRSLFLLPLALGLLPFSLRADVDRSHPPEPGPAPTASFPDYQQAKLANGLKVFVVENHREPTVTFRLLFKSGDAAEGDKAGLADAVAALLNKGTTHRNSLRFAQETDFIGATVEAASGPDSFSVAADGLTKYLPKVLDLFTDATLHPTFPKDELAKYQRQTISALERQKQTPSSLAARLRGKLIYGSKNPYGSYPDEKSVASITTVDVEKYHAAHFTPGNATLAVVGDVRAADIVPLLDKALADWKPSADGEGGKDERFPPLADASKGLSIHLVDRPGSVQSNVLVSCRGVPRANPDVPEMGVMNSILGGGFSGRLFQNLREKHGYTYGSSSAFSMNRYGGIFSASAEVRNAVTVPATEEILNEIRRLRTELVPEKELGMQRQYLAGNYLLSLESPATTAERVQAIDLYGLPADYFRTYVKRVSEVSAEQVGKLANKYIDVEDATIVVVGEAKEVKDALAKLGPVTVYDTDLKARTE